MASFLTDDVVLYDHPTGGHYMNWFPDNGSTDIGGIKVWYWEYPYRAGQLYVLNNSWPVAIFKIKDLHEALSRIKP